MKKLLVCLLLITACGKHDLSKYRILEKEIEVEKLVPVKQDFEGVYYFDNGSSIELVVSADGEVTILRDRYNLVFKNKLNSDYGTFPVVVKENLEPGNESIRFSVDVNFGSSSQYDLERDDTGSNITGTHKVDFVIAKQSDGKIKLTITVYEGRINNNLNKVIFFREKVSF